MTFIYFEKYSRSNCFCNPLSHSLIPVHYMSASSTLSELLRVGNAFTYQSVPVLEE